MRGAIRDSIFVPRRLDNWALAVMLARTPYVEGGRTKSGLDCLGLVLSAFREAADVALPDPVEDQGGSPFRMAALADLFVHIPSVEAQPGDVVVFLDAESSRHVGLVVSGGRLVHTGETTGIVRQRLARVLLRSHKVLRYVGVGHEPKT